MDIKTQSLRVKFKNIQVEKMAVKEKKEKDLKEEAVEAEVEIEVVIEAEIEVEEVATEKEEKVIPN